MTDLTVPNAQYNKDCAGPLIGPKILISEFHSQFLTLLGLVSGTQPFGTSAFAIHITDKIYYLHYGTRHKMNEPLLSGLTR